MRCWGADTDSADALWASVLAAIDRRYSAGAYQFTGEAWDTEPASTELGEVVTGTVTLSLAVLDRAPTTVRLTAATLSPAPITP